MGERFSSGKNTVTKNVSALFTSQVKRENIQLKVDNQDTIKVNELSTTELIKLSQQLLDLAQQKEKKEQIYKTQ